MTISFGIHKDQEPAKTVQRVQGILRSLGIQTYEDNWAQATDHSYSFTLHDADFPATRTGGKGVSRSWALASGYAEFIERIQTGFLYKREYGLMPHSGRLDRDLRRVPTEEVLKEHQHIIPFLCSPPSENLIDLLGDELTCAPFFHVNSGRVVDLPIDLIQQCTWTTGVCAGNTPHEAILHGICEVLEKYVRREVLLTQAEAPTIACSSVRHLEIRELVTSLRGQGFSILLKDCSLGGRLPVAGAVVFNRDRSRCEARFGADPFLEVSLQRSLVEAVQGVRSSADENWSRFDLSAFSNRPDSGLRHQCNAISELTKSKQLGRGRVPTEFLFSHHSGDWQAPFQRRFRSNRESLNWLLDLLRSQGHDIFVRDVSDLGFPSYYVYIPGMSEDVGPMDEQRLRYHWSDRVLFGRVLLGLGDAELESVKEVVLKLESYLEHPFFSVLFRERPMSEWMGIRLMSSSSSFGGLDVRQLLALMSLRIGDYRKAFLHLDEYVKSGADLGGLELYTRGVLTYFKLRSAGSSAESARLHLSEVFGNHLCSEVLADVGEPESAFQHLTLPACGDCGRCAVSEDCYFETWEKRISSIRDAIALRPEIGQGELATVLGNR